MVKQYAKILSQSNMRSEVRKERTLLSWIFILLLLLGWNGSWAQLITETFNYTAHATNGLPTQSSSVWTNNNTGDEVLVTSGSLSYSGLTASVGNKIAFDGAGADPSRTFTSQPSTVNATVYSSFILNVSSLGSLTTTGGYFTGLGSNGTTYGACVWTRKSAVDATKFNIGISTRSNSTVSWLATDYVVGTSYFIVSAYQITTGTANDVGKIWVNPALGATTEPATNATAATGTDLTAVAAVFVRQDSASATPFIQMDEMRVGTTWASVTPSAATPTVALADNGTQVAAANVSQGTTNVVLNKIQLGISTGDATLSGMTCTTTGTYAVSDITNLKVRYSTDATLDAGDATLSTLTSGLTTAGSQTFPSFTSQLISSGTTGYIFITADVKNTATHNNTIGVNAIASTNLTIANATYSPTPSTTNGGLQTFKDVTAPTVSSFNPLNGATTVALASNLIITFSENVKAGTTGFIKLYDSSSNLIESFPFNSGLISFSGTTATINPTNDLNYSTSYYVTVDSGAITDTQDVAFAGFSNTTTWAFTTPNQPPVNDTCASATALTLGNTNSGGTFFGSTVDFGSSRDVWYSFVPTCSGNHTININFPGDNSENIDFEVYATTCPTSTTGRLQLFGGDGPSLTPIANSSSSSDETADLQNAVAGTTYYIRVIDASDVATTFDITVSTTVTPSITLSNTGTPAAGNIAAGANNVVLYGFALTPSACTSSFNFSAANIQTSGDAGSSDLSNFRLIVDANNNGLADSGEISSAIATASFTNGNPLSFSSLSQSLTGGTVKRYLLIADVNSGAGNAKTFTASLSSSDITADQTVTGGPASGNLQTITATSISIADNGTQVTAGTILRGTNTTVISKVKLTVAGGTPTVSQIQFVTAGSAGAYVQSDIASNGFRLWKTSSSTFDTNTPIGAVSSSKGATATNNDTLAFSTSETLSPGDYYYWLTVDVASSSIPSHTINVNGLTNASVTSAGTTILGTTSASGTQTIISPTITIADNTVVTAGTVLVNATDAIIARAQLTASNANTNVTDISFVTAGASSGYTSADIAANGFKLWYSTTNTFGSASLFGTAQSSTKSVATNTETITFNDSQALTNGTPYYFWLTASISSGATPGKTITANGLSGLSVTSSTTGAFIAGSSSVSGTQTINDNAPSLSTTPASVDAPFSITLSPDNSNYRGAITSVKIGATSLVFTTSAGNITLDPANASNTLLRTPGNKTIDIVATNYTNAQVTQLMLVGAPAKLSISQQPTAPATNGGALAQQPVVLIQDKYNNATTSTQSVQATVGAGTWTLNGTNPVSGVNGTATFTNLTATSGAAVTGATITFSLPNVSGTTVLATSGTFNIPAPTATHLVFVTPPTNGVTNSNVAQVRVEARTASETLDTSFTGAITITASGPGTISATTLSKAATAGVATFNDIKFDTAGSYSLKADASTFPQVSTPVTVVDPIAKWTFEGVTTTNTGATVNVSAGSAVADAGLQTSGTSFTAVHASSATTWSNVAGNGSSKSVSANTWAVGDYFQFKVNTSGYTAIKILLDQTGSNTGPRDFKIQYSTATGGASGYTDFISYSVPQTAAPAAIGWSSTATQATSLSTMSFDLSSISALNGKSEIYFRVVDNSTVSLQNGTVATGGTGRIDNFTVLGTPCQPVSASVTAGTSPICSGSVASFTLNGTPNALVNYTLNSVANSVTLNGSGSATVTVNNATATQNLVLVSASNGSCSNAVSGSASVSITPNVGTPVFSSGATTVCQNAPDTTYTASATNSTGVTYSVAPSSAGVIDANTGVMNWDAAFNGAATITATATGCNGPATADRVVTVNALPSAFASDVTGCSGTPIALSGSGLPTGGSGVYSVANPYTGTTSTTYTYTYTDSNGCSATSASANITITAQPQWYLDADGDHYYTGTAVSSCTSPGAGYTTTGLLGGGDCNDADNTIYPGAAEICYNNILENCTGTMSQGCAPVVVNMTPSYNNTTLASLSTAIPAVAYTYAPYTNLKYRFRITNITTNTTAADIIQTSRYVTIPASIHSYNAQYSITVSAVINDEVVPFAGNTITLNSPTVQLVTLNSATCGATLAALTSTLTANAGLNATGYTFRIRLNDSNPSPTYAYSQSSTRFISANSFTGFPLQYATSYKVAVQFTFNDPVTNLPVQSGYGSECTVNTPSIPVTTMASPTCGSQVTAMNANISATAASYATGYQFRIRLFADNGANPTYNTSVANASRFSSLTAFTGQGPLTLAYNTEYAVSVRYSILNGSTTVWSDWGPDCKVKTPFFPVTSLVPSQCGLTTATSLTQQLNITPYPGFPNYKVKLDEVSGEDVVNSQEIVITYPYFRLNQFSIAQLGKNYNVSVSIKLNGEFGPYDTACDLFTEAPSKMIAVVPFKATAYPNPFANNFMLDVKSSSQSNVSIKVYDMIGRMIEQKEVRVSDMETTTIGDQYPSGVYNVVVSQEDSVETVRVVKR